MSASTTQCWLTMLPWEKAARINAMPQSNFVSEIPRQLKWNKLARASFPVWWIALRLHNTKIFVAFHFNWKLKNSVAVSEPCIDSASTFCKPFIIKMMLKIAQRQEEKKWIFPSRDRAGKFPGSFTAIVFGVGEEKALDSIRPSAIAMQKCAVLLLHISIQWKNFFVLDFLGKIFLVFVFFALQTCIRL